MASGTVTWSIRALMGVVALAGCASEELSSTEQAIVDPSDFTLPSLTDAQRAAIVNKYPQLDPTAQVPRGLLEDALIYYDVNYAAIPKHEYFVVVDLSLHSGKNRFWMVNTATGAVEKHKVAHGDGSDPDNNGYATQFSNTSGSHMSSLGFYLTGEIYDGTHPHSMRLDGLSPDGSPNQMANTNVRDRAVVVHEASYVDDANAGQQGRSNGCLALDPDIEAGVVDRIHDGTLIYAAISPLHPPIGPGDGSPCSTIAPTGGVVDDGSPCFAARGPATGLHTETTAGMGNRLTWTRTTAVAYEQNYAEWTLEFAEAGRYRVEVYTAAAFAQSKQAQYSIVAGGVAQDVTIDQTAIDGYQTLGEFDFAAGGDQFVHLSDNTGETTHTQLVFDAVQLTRIGPPDDGKVDDPGTTDDDEGEDAASGCSAGGGGSSALIGLALLGLYRRRRRP
jgi:MYXO-CTERM domain-containing protein